MFRNLLNNARDLAPIILVIGFFQLAVLQQPLPNLGELLVGLVLVPVALLPIAALFLRAEEGRVSDLDEGVQVGAAAGV